MLYILLGKFAVEKRNSPGYDQQGFDKNENGATSLLLFIGGETIFIGSSANGSHKRKKVCL